MYAVLATQMNLNKEQFQRMFSDEDLEQDTRIGWKYTSTRTYNLTSILDPFYIIIFNYTFLKSVQNSFPYKGHVSKTLDFCPQRE